MKHYIIILGVMLAVFISCKQRKEGNTANLKVYKDEVFTNLFHKDSHGVTGADGTISVPLLDGSSLFMMGDSFLGEVVNKQRDSHTKMINNTFIIVNPEHTKVEAIYGGEHNEPNSFITSVDVGTYYWPGHGFVQDSIFHLFMSKFEKMTGIDDVWGFKYVGVDYFKYTVEGLKKISVKPFAFSRDKMIHWGHAVLKDGNYIYIYGSKVDKDSIGVAHVCRTVLDDKNNLDFKKIEFFDGNNWSVQSEFCQPMCGTTSSISEQFSIFKYVDKYILLSQQRGIRAGAIYTYISDTPQGPWRNKKMIYKTRESSLDPDLFTYNAMAHPQYIENDELLICYNINSLKVSRIFSNVNCYRPVFLRVPMKLILGN